MDSLTQIIEGMVFAAGRLVAADEMREAIRATSGDQDVSDEEIAAVVKALNEGYEQADSAMRIYEWADGYRMATVPALAPFLKAFFQEGPRKLTRSLMETLSIVAYRQPISKPEIDDVRGVDSNYALRRLMELGFVSMAGRSETIGRPLVFTTTGRFLEEFGMRSIDDLPHLREAEELLADGEFGSLIQDARDATEIRIQENLPNLDEQRETDS